MQKHGEVKPKEGVDLNTKKGHGFFHPDGALI